MDYTTLPPEVTALLGASPRVDRPFQGANSETAIITSSTGRLILKIASTPQLGAALAAEQRVLHALSGQQPWVPTPRAFVPWINGGVSVQSYLAGQNMVEALPRLDAAGRHALAAAYGWALRRVHSWDINLPNAAGWRERVLARAARRVASGHVANPIDHPGEFNGADPLELLAQLRLWLSDTAEDIVFAHGDYCLPNVMVEEGCVVGVVDWVHGGYADRRYDLAAGIWSLRYNLREEAYVRTFLTAYGFPLNATTLRPFEALYVLS